MGTAELCGLASCLGLWLNKQVKSPDKDASWSLQPHLHPQLPSALLHSASSSGAGVALHRLSAAAAISNKSGGHCDGKPAPVIQLHNFFTTSVSLSKQTGSRQEAVDPAVCFI